MPAQICCAMVHVPMSVALLGHESCPFTRLKYEIFNPNMPSSSNTGTSNPSVPLISVLVDLIHPSGLQGDIATAVDTETAQSPSTDPGELLSAEDSQITDAIISRLPAFQAENKKASWWGFYKHVDGNTFACQICAPWLGNLNAEDKKDKKGFVKYGSAAGSSSLRRHVEKYHNTLHDNVKKRLVET